MKIGVFLPNWVGDVCMAVPALRAMRRGLSRGIRLVGIGRGAASRVMQDQPWLDSWLMSPGRKASWKERCEFTRLMREEELHAVVLMTNSLGSAALAMVAGVKRRIGYARDARSWFLTDRLTPPKTRGRFVPISPIDYYLELANHLGCPSVDRQMELFTHPRYVSMASQLWEEVGFSASQPTVVLNNHSGSDFNRKWRNDYLVDLAVRLERQFGFQVLFHCGPGEQQETNEVAGECRSKRIRSMGILDSLPIGLSQAVFARSELVVSTDSGARHLALAMNRPVVTLFGPTQPRWTTTYNQPEVCVEPPGQTSGPNQTKQVTRRTTDGIQVDQVLRAIEFQLERNRSQAA